MPGVGRKDLSASSSAGPLEVRGGRTSTRRKSRSVLVEASTEFVASADELNADSAALRHVHNVCNDGLAPASAGNHELEIDDRSQWGKWSELHEGAAPADVRDVAFAVRFPFKIVTGRCVWNRGHPRSPRSR